MSLDSLDVLVVDCQATSAGPHGHLIELGWMRAGPCHGAIETRLVRLPDHARIPPAVTRVTGISDRLLRDGVSMVDAWQALAADAARLGRQPAPTVVHFAQFERPFLGALEGGSPALDVVCTHEIARRVLPDLPRRSLRALTGYFGRGVGALRRSGEHVAATAFVWQALARMLETDGIGTWDQLRAWLALAPRVNRRARRVWPMPRDVRLSVPAAPGVYRMLRTSGDVLYVGKATSLRDRVNSYFRQQRGTGDRLLEMLSQARGLSYDVTPTALEAALLEADEIKRHRPPYNVALTTDARDVWFTSRDLLARAPCASRDRPLGPFPSALALDQFAALTRGRRSAAGDGPWAPPEDVFEDGLRRLRAAHLWLSRGDLPSHRGWLRLGARLWAEGRRDRELDDAEAERADRAGTWTAERVQAALERVALRAAHGVRRARWLTRLVDASVAWSEPGVEGMRLIVMEAGECVHRASLAGIAGLPVPPGAARPVPLRQACFSVATFDRVRVLLTELKRRAADGALVAVRLGPGPPLTGGRLARVLAWL